MAEEKQEKVLEVKNLRVSFRTNTGTVKAVRGISFSLYKGRTLAIVGESGSGKSVTSKAILGILANNKIVEDGQILFDGKNLLTLTEDKFTKIRGTKISMIFQDPLSALNPIMKVGKQLTEAMYLQHKATVKFAKEYLKRFDKVAAKYVSSVEDKVILSLSKYKEKYENEDALYEGLNIEGYKDLFTRLVNEESKTYVENLNNAKSLLANLNYTYLSGDAAMFDIESFTQESKAVVKALSLCNTILEIESDDLIDVYGDVLATDIEQIKTSISLRAHQDEILNKYNAADIFDVPAAARIKEREVIVPVATYYQSIVDTTEKLFF